MSRKKPTIKELNSVVEENKAKIELLYKYLEEVKFYTSGLDRILDWYIDFQGNVEDFKKFIEDKKLLGENEDENGTENSISDKQQDISKKKSSSKVSKKTK
jgi:hypothetical protein